MVVTISPIRIWLESLIRIIKEIYKFGYVAELIDTLPGESKKITTATD